MSALPLDSLQRNKEEITDRDGVKTIEELHVCMYSCKFSLLMYYYQYRPLTASAGMLYGWWNLLPPHLEVHFDVK